MSKELCNRKKKLISLILVAILLMSSFQITGIQSKAATYPYLIKVNKAACTITIYKKDSKGKYTVPVKAMICSPGWETPVGTFKTPAKYRWKELIGPSWGQYSTRITGGYLFHSVWYYSPEPSTMANKEYNKLGTICSHGCIRLTTEDAKWIYDNCPVGTTVTIYNDSKNPGPLGKPEGIKLLNTTGQGYDPTDIWSKNNPYNSKKPSISGAKNKTITYGTSVDVMSGVTAKTTTGVDGTSKLKATIKYNTKTVKKVDSKKPGKYTVTYSITDLLNRTAKKTVTFTVKENTTVPKLTGVKDMTVGNVELTRDLLLKNVTAKWNGKTVDKKNIKTTVEETEKKDIYKVTYKVTASNGKTATQTAKITVDRQGPTISGIQDKVVLWNETVTEEMALEGITVKDNISAEKEIDLTVTITKDAENNVYNIVYKAVDKLGNETIETAVYTITDGLRIEGTENKEIGPEVVVDKNYAMQGVKAYNGTVDVTEQVETSITKNADGDYVIVYTIKDDMGNKVEERVVFIVGISPETPTPETTEIPE